LAVRAEEDGKSECLMVIIRIRSRSYFGAKAGRLPSGL